MLRYAKYFIFIFFCSTSFAQEKDSSTLKMAIDQLEREYGVKFSFSENTIEDMPNVSVDSDGNLENALTAIAAKTGLIIKKINDRYYTISQKSHIGVICGYVLDGVTQEPLPYVTVRTSTKGVVSDKRGYYELKDIDINDTITFSYIGYSHVTKGAKEFRDNDCGRTVLQEAINTLNEVIISSYLTNGIVKKNDGSITLVPKEQGILPGLTEADVLLSTQQLPGVQSPSENASGIHIRGGTPDQNLILFDGIKLYNTAHFFGSISAFNPYVVDEVTLYKSASNVKFGNHIGGVLDIRTMSDVPEKTSIGAGVNFTNADISAILPLGKKIGMQFSFRRSISDLANTPTFDRLSQKVFQNTVISEGNVQARALPFVEQENNFGFNDYNVKVIMSPNRKNSISLQHIHIENDLKYVLSNSMDKESRSDVIDIENHGSGITWKAQWNKKSALETYAYYTAYSLLYDGEKQRNDFVYNFTTKRNNVRELSIGTLLSHEISKKSQIKYGYQFTRSQLGFDLEQESRSLATGTRRNDDRTNNQQSLLGEYIHSASDKHHLSMGLRAGYIPLLKRTFLEPRVYGRLKLLEGLWVNASLESKQQYTAKIIEFFTSDFGLENELWALSNNSDIPVLTSRQATIGALYDNRGWLLDTEFYLKRITGLTSLSTGLNGSSGETIFNGSANILGAEVLLRKQWTPKVSTWASYTFSENNLDFVGFNQGRAFRGNFSIANAFYFGQQVNWGSFDLSMGWNLRSGLPFSSIISTFDEQQLEIQELTGLNEQLLPAYHRLDASLTYAFYWNKKKRIKSKVGISFINIYNRENILQRAYEKEIDEPTSNEVINTIDTFSLGFTPNAVFRVKF